MSDTHRRNQPKMVPWTEDEIDLLKARYATEGGSRLVAVLGRSRRTISEKARGLNLQCKWARTPKRIIFTPEQDAILKKEWPFVQRHKQSVERVAEKLGVSIPKMRFRAGQLGLTAPRKYGHRLWMPEEDEILTENAGLTPQTIAKKIKAATGRCRTRVAILNRMRHLELNAKAHRDYYSASELARILGVSTIPVLRWIKLGWLKANQRGQTQNDFGGPGDQWMIKPRDVRKFIIDHTSAAANALATADKIWLVDLLVGHKASGC